MPHIVQLGLQGAYFIWHAVNAKTLVLVLRGMCHSETGTLKLQG
jgi:hypothetical protein